MDGEIRDGDIELGDDMGFDSLSVRWVGALPLLMHNERLANPMDPLTAQLAELNGRPTKERKTPAHIEATLRVEWEGGLYCADDIGPYVPGHNVLACIRDGAKFQKLGKTVTQVVAIPESRIAVEYDGPRTLDGMWKARMVDVRGVKIGRSKVQRARPIFTSWALTFTVRFVAEVIDRKTMIGIMKEAGSMVGLGDFKQRFGRFTVEAA